MSPTEVTVLRRYNEWLRDKSNWPPSPMQIEKAIAAAIEMIERLEAAEKERDALRAKVAALVDDMNLLRNNNTALRAKITEMERQEPVAEWTENRFHQYPQLVWNKKYRVNIGDKLYTLPGAKGE